MTSHDQFGVPSRRRGPVDPLLSLPDHPSGEWAMPRPASSGDDGWPESAFFDSWPEGAAPAEAAQPRATAEYGEGPTRPASRIGHPRPARSAPEEPALPPTGRRAYGVDAELGTGPAADGGRGRGRLMALALVLVLIGVSGWQAWRLDRLDKRLGGSNDQLAAALRHETERADRLEKQVAGVFNPESISADVLPSVFRVRAGQFTGTAFAIGDKAGSGKANLLTNYHVVEAVFTDGGRRVLLERGRTEVEATIVKVDRGKDLALLRADRKISGLAAATDEVRPGQQILVAGAPLGLEDTVTTGVVSAYRPDDKDGPVIQFDAPINPGNSGGPVVDSSDRVIGLATAKARDAEGIGLAVPIKTACDTFDVC
ncbi:putative serine protease PepD [Krasilnikovia cinnamomea]|uniref:Putative serine protease PepD n=1 Tax=Krasilnikovia cinnamomea TaxID=349313 RepID=A0A4Q7ZFM7_9ACTN|nr:S1C family serine protease [Krasilnikovia cinnamomea]RZU49582.1 putative serine protease PepD [Krasilnikovia cinnamomea]